MNKKLHYTIVLFSVCLASALGLGVTFVLTEKPIQDKQKQKADQALSRVLPMAAEFAPLGQGGFKGLDGNKQVVGYAASASAQGYGSMPIQVMVGFKANVQSLQIVGVRVVDQQETPGLGANIQSESTSKTLWTVLGLATPSAKPPPSFQNQFGGLLAADIQLSKSPEPGKVTAITGATISSTAVLRAVKAAGDKVHGVVAPEAGPDAGS